MKVVSINGSPRRNWNTSILVSEAAEGARASGAEVKEYDLYDIGDFKGCVSCFGCKLDRNMGKCVHRDALTPILEDIRTADGLILGTPNYLGDVSAGLRALYERLVFQYITYKIEPKSHNDRSIPVLLIMTSNVPEDAYQQIGYESLLMRYKQTLDNFIGPTEILISGDTLQVNDYERYDWSIFDPAKKIARRESEFPKERRKAYDMGADLIQRSKV